MRLFQTINPTFKNIYCTVSAITKYRLPGFLVLLCFLAGNCEVCSGASNVRLSSNDINISNSYTDSVSYMQIPVHGKVISPFGYRGRHRHTGTDIKLHKGDAVRAAVSGVVTMAASFYGYGNLIILKHSNNVETYYSHLSKCIVHVGDSVVAGAVIGLGGRTGRATTDHLHFEIRFNKVAQNAQKYFDFSNNKIKESIYANIPEIKAKKNKEHEVNVADTKINASKDFVIIQKGDTLNSIAQNMGTSVEQLQELNQIQSAGLMPGMKLKIK